MPDVITIVAVLLVARGVLQTFTKELWWAWVHYQYIYGWTDCNTHSGVGSLDYTLWDDLVTGRHRCLRRRTPIESHQDNRPSRTSKVGRLQEVGS